MKSKTGEGNYTITTNIDSFTSGYINTDIESFSSTKPNFINLEAEAEKWIPQIQFFYESVYVDCFCANCSTSIKTNDFIQQLAKEKTIRNIQINTFVEKIQEGILMYFINIQWEEKI